MAPPEAGRLTILTGSDVAGLGDEGYRLQVEPDRVVIAASKPAGAFYGCQTCGSFCRRRSCARASLQGQFLDDAVRLDRRPAAVSLGGVMLDSARSFHSKQFVLDFIDMVAGFKINVLDWHLTDDEGWRLEVPKIPSSCGRFARPFRG